MKRFFARFRNRYVLSTSVAVLYILVLHNTDIYTLYKRKQRVAELEAEIERKRYEIVVMKENIANLQDLRSLERYARENYLFKKQDEDVFVFSFE